MENNFNSSDSVEYLNFLNKFKQKKTTDDCFTPPAVYDVVVDRVIQMCPHMAGRTIVRPFYPGGDYEHYEYPKNCIVIDNPPFSLYSKIVRFFLKKKIAFFLFCPGLTPIVRGADVTYIVTNSCVVYTNAARVNTSFVTNLFPGIRILSDNILFQRIQEVQNSNKPKKCSILYPQGFITLPLLHKFVSNGQDFCFLSNEVSFASTLDNYGNVFGGGYLLSHKALERYEKLERTYKLEHSEKQITLSEREKEIIKQLDL